MHPQDLLLGAFVYLAAAVIAAPIATRLGLGSVLGYLVAGMVIGPSVMGLVGREGADVMHFAEFGVVVMLFLVGLELQPSKLWALRRPIIGLGGLQVTVTAAAIAAGAWALGFSWQASVTTGLILAMSSTAIVLQSLNERGLLKTASGQSCFSVLLFQDIAVIPILAFLPLLAVAKPHDAHDATLIGDLPGWAQTLAVLAAVAIIVLAGRFLTRPLFRLVADTGIREVFVGLALVMVVGIALLMQQVGLSAALGTFLAGVVLAESEYRHELEMDLEPFKGLLLAVFFIAVGAGIDFSLLLNQPLLILGLVLGFILIKLAVLFLLARLFAMGGPDASRFSFALAQGGEFAFVLISFAAGLALLDPAQSGLLVAVVALSMAAAPLLMIFDQRVMQPLFEGKAETRASDTIEETGTKVIIAGHGRFGMTVGRMLQASGIRAVVLDHDAEQIEALRKFGYKVYYGDASRHDLLEAAGAAEAQALVIAIDDKREGAGNRGDGAPPFPQPEDPRPRLRPRPRLPPAQRRRGGRPPRGLRGFRGRRRKAPRPPRRPPLRGPPRREALQVPRRGADPPRRQARRRHRPPDRHRPPGPRGDRARAGHRRGRRRPVPRPRLGSARQAAGQAEDLRQS